MLWGAGKSISVLRKTCCGMFRGPKSGKQEWFGEDQVWKNRERRVQKEPIARKQVLVCRHLSLISAVCLIFSLNFISSDFPGCGASWAVCMCGEGLSASGWGGPAVGGPCACGASMGCDEGAPSVNDTGQHHAGPASKWGTWPGGWAEGVPRGETTDGFG